MIRENYKVSVKKLEELPANSAVNLVLSGGGEKGVAHLAMLKKIEQLNLRLASISGCSAGAIVGAMYASGTSLDDIFNFFKQTEMFKLSWMTFSKPGLFNTNKYKTRLEGNMAADFSDLKIPLHVNTTNIQNGNSYYFSKGTLIDKVLASCAIPGFFNPVEIDGELHSDGGVLDNFPVKPFVDSDIPVVGSYVNLPSYKNRKSLNTTIKVAIHAMKLKSFASEQIKFFDTYYTACFPLGGYSIFSQKKISLILKDAESFLTED